MNTSSDSSSELPHVEVFLSRHAYPLGSAVVGTVFVRPHKEQQNEDLRSILQSVTVYVAGFCRIDARWHNVTDYIKLYGKVHPFVQSLIAQGIDQGLLTPPEDTVCFWATNGLELLELPERKEGKWDGSLDNMLAFTFRVDLPFDVPHSVNTNSAKYSYSAEVIIRTSAKQRVVKTPFLVWTNPKQPIGDPRSQQQQANRAISAGRVKFATCQGMAHSIGLPCHVSTTEINRPKGQMTVALPHSRDDVQTLRVSNAVGNSVCVMTIFGATKLTPGSRIHLQWDFPETISASKSWIPCAQVSACLIGEEKAVYEDGTTTRSQSFVFDTCQEWVDPGVTQRVSKTLLLSMDAPCNLYTDVMELTITCRVDITVKENGDYNNLKIEIPCHVVHSFGQEEDIFEREENETLPLAALLGHDVDQKSVFPVHDITQDLKNLALQLEERMRQSLETR